ncbi:hypothetical protein EBS80_00305 [bacterium]|nr:hypothetical protein [bacterium]
MKPLRRFAYECLIAWSVTAWSTMLSFRENPLFDETKAFQFNPADPSSVVGYGGFPLRVFAYPVPPLGPGPAQSLFPLFQNFIVWLAVTILLMYLLPRWKQEEESVVRAGSIVIAAFSTLCWLGYILFKFD